MIEAIDALAAIFAFPAVALKRIFEGGKEHALFIFLIILVFSITRFVLSDIFIIDGCTMIYFAIFFLDGFSFSIFVLSDVFIIDGSTMIFFDIFFLDGFYFAFIDDVFF